MLIAEDNDDLRGVMGPLIDDQPDMQCVAAVARLSEVTPRAATCRADVALLDLELRDGSVMPHLAGLCRSSPTTRFIIHSGHANPELKIRCHEAGALAYVSKSGDVDALIATIRRVAAL